MRVNPDSIWKHRGIGSRAQTEGSLWNLVGHLVLQQPSPPSSTTAKVTFGRFYCCTRRSASSDTTVLVLTHGDSMDSMERNTPLVPFHPSTTLWPGASGASVVLYCWKWAVSIHPSSALRYSGFPTSGQRVKLLAARASEPEINQCRALCWILRQSYSTLP